MAAAASTTDPQGQARTLDILRANTARFVEMNAALGGLFTQSQAALLLGISNQRIAFLVGEGRLRIHEFTIEHVDGETEVVGRYISGAQIERYLAEDRKAPHRPSKLRMAVAGMVVK